jgi:hypothetical protein
MPYNVFPDDPAWKKVQEYLALYIDEFGDLNSKDARERCRYELPELVEKTANVDAGPSDGSATSDKDSAVPSTSTEKQARR